MLKKFIIAASAATMFAAPAMARHDHGHHYGERTGYDHRYYEDRGYYGGRGYSRDRGYDRAQTYGGYRDGYCRKDSNTGGTVLGAIGGGVVGNVVGQRGDRTAATLLGAGLGALLGHQIDKGEYRCR